MSKVANVFCGDCVEIMQSLPISDLIICDPPYFKVISQKWDYQWRTEEEYLEWSKKYLSICYEKLRIGGTMYLFGYFKILAKLLPILEDLGFSLRQQIIIDKGIKAVAGRATKNYKQFPTCTESVLFLIKDNIQFSRKLLKKRQLEMGLSSKEINEALGCKSNGGGMWSIYTGKNICEQFPTKEQWDKLQEVLKFDYDYSKIAQTYNSQMGITDVWNDIDFYKEKRFHPTQKPINLIERLLLASSNEGDVIIDCFGGGGSTAIACKNLNRECYIIEQDEKYCKIIEERLKNE